MYKQIDTHVQLLLDNQAAHWLQRSKIGIEKESLRVGHDGSIAQTAHPYALGAAHTHPQITTDYSEALLELITPPLMGIDETLTSLKDIHHFVYQQLDKEYLWNSSMPCVIHGEMSIPIANYGSSHTGMMKTVYRRGLGLRYGRIMQAIAGVHFNYSLHPDFWAVFQSLLHDNSDPQDFINTHYFNLTRNLQRYGWLISYLFGSSPAVCTSFLDEQRPRSLQPFDDHTYYSPYATSLRMGDIGYQNNKEDETGVKICYDNVDNYANSLLAAVTQTCPNYAKMGIEKNGIYQQLNANILQIENEYYSTVRPKQIPHRLEMPSLALKRRGVQYIELRSLDINAYDPLGMNAEQLHFLEAFILFCLFQDSPPISPDERAEINWNQNAAAFNGRDPSQLLRRQGKSQLLRTWASEICHHLQGICEILDTDKPTPNYQHALDRQLDVVHDTDQTPSARMLDEMRKNREGYHDFTRRLSWQHKTYFDNLPMNKAVEQRFQRMASDSHQAQADIEAADTGDFSHFLQQYFKQAKP